MLSHLDFFDSPSRVCIRVQCIAPSPDTCECRNLLLWLICKLSPHQLPNLFAFRRSVHWLHWDLADPWRFECFDPWHSNRNGPHWILCIGPGCRRRHFHAVNLCWSVWPWDFDLDRECWSSIRFPSKSWSVWIACSKHPSLLVNSEPSDSHIAVPHHWLLSFLRPSQILSIHRPKRDLGLPAARSRSQLPF